MLTFIFKAIFIIVLVLHFSVHVYAGEAIKSLYKPLQAEEAIKSLYKPLQKDLYEKEADSHNSFPMDNGLSIKPELIQQLVNKAGGYAEIISLARDDRFDEGVYIETQDGESFIIGFPSQGIEYGKTFLLSTMDNEVMVYLSTDGELTVVNGADSIEASGVFEQVECVILRVSDEIRCIIQSVLSNISLASCREGADEFFSLCLRGGGGGDDDGGFFGGKPPVDGGPGGTCAVNGTWRSINNPDVVMTFNGFFGTLKMSGQCGSWTGTDIAGGEKITGTFLPDKKELGDACCGFKLDGVFTVCDKITMIFTGIPTPSGACNFGSFTDVFERQ
ncbi:MAG: hypothetical protein ACUZ8H_00100 [Candidatus Anammoxibacter sp.]